MLKTELEINSKPYIGPYESARVKYGKYVFDEDWANCGISIIENKTLDWYMNALPQDAMWKIVCIYLDVEPTAQTISELKLYANDVKFEGPAK